MRSHPCPDSPRSACCSRRTFRAPRRIRAWSRARRACDARPTCIPSKMWPELFRGREIFLRIDPGFGRGVTISTFERPGRISKFGVALAEAVELEALVASAGGPRRGVCTPTPAAAFFRRGELDRNRGTSRGSGPAVSRGPRHRSGGRDSGFRTKAARPRSILRRLARASRRSS